MNSFNDVLSLIVTALQNDSALTAFCQAKWNKPLTVKRVFKKRTEINTKDLPIILITTPSVSKSFLTGARDGTHTVIFYAGFHQDNRDKAQEEVVEFEEKIDDAILNSQALIDAALSLFPTESANDEGKFHPHYFIAMQNEVKHRRTEAT